MTEPAVRDEWGDLPADVSNSPKDIEDFLSKGFRLTVYVDERDIVYFGKNGRPWGRFTDDTNIMSYHILGQRILEALILKDYY